MKKQVLIFIMLFALNFLFAQEKSNTIIGKWIGTDERNQTAGIEFTENGKARLLMMGNEMPSCDYKADLKKDPIPISLINKINGKTMIIYGLIKFIDPNSIKWEVFPMVEKQPLAFSKNSNGTSVILKREK